MQLDKKECKKKIEQIVVIRCQNSHRDQSLTWWPVSSYRHLVPPTPLSVWPSPFHESSATAKSHQPLQHPASFESASFPVAPLCLWIISIPSITEISQVCFSSLWQLHFSVIFVFLPILFTGFLFPLWQSDWPANHRFQLQTSYPSKILCLLLS